MKIISANYSLNAFINHPTEFIGKDVDLRGSVFKLRSLGKMSFLLLKTYGGIFQVLFNQKLNLTEGSSVSIKGKAQAANLKEEFIEHKNIEVLGEEIHVLSRAEENLPFSVNKSKLNIGNELKFNHRSLSLRHPKEQGIFKIQAALVQGLRNYFIKNLCVELRTPKIVKAGAEGGANIFELQYFEQKAYLTQSPQFYKEFGTGVFERVFEIAPVFRAEKHNTSRHLSEYTSVDVEIGQITHFSELMSFELGAIKSALNYLREKCFHELKLLQVALPVINEVPSYKFSQAKEILEQKYSLKSENIEDLSPEEEQKFSEYIKEKYKSEFVFVTHYPSSKRPFYAMECPENKEETLSFDLLFKGVEITTGGQRIHEYSALLEKMRARNMAVKSFEFFTEAHKFGLPPHGGFGLGLERFTQKLLSLSNVKEATLFPRDRTRLTP